MNDEYSGLIEIDKVRPDMILSRGIAWKSTFPFANHVLSKWIVNIPSQAKYGELYFIAMIRLRTGNQWHDKRVYEYGTHQIMVYPLESKKKIYINGFPPYIDVPTFLGQWYCSDDIQARDLVRSTVAGICQGEFDPSGKDKENWILLYGSSLVEKATIDLTLALSKNEVH